MTSRGVWWLSPPGAVALIAAPMLLLAATTPDIDYRTAWGTPKLLTDQTALLAMSGVAVFALAAVIPLFRSAPPSAPWPNLSEDRIRFMRRAADWLFWISVAGYAAFAFNAYRNGLRFGDISSALQSQDLYGVNADLQKITGVTSLTQVGPAFVVVAMLVLIHERDRKLRFRLGIFLVLGTVRALLASERLAIMELLVPIATVLAFRAVAVGSRRRRLATAVAPAVLIPLVLVFFGAFEYFRSWAFYSTHTTISFPRFVIERLGGYYVTAYNNGQVELDYQAHVGRIPYDSIRAVWTAPGSSLYGGYPGSVDPSTQLAGLLSLHANPEYNSPGGLIVPFVDWGTIGGFVFLAIFGVALGLLYRRCRDGGLFGVLLFPSATTGLFEMTRYFPWTQGRYTPALVSLCIVGYLARRRSSSEPPPVPAAAPELQTADV